MAVSQRRKSASTNKRGGAGVGVAGAVERYVKDLGRVPLAVRTKEAYGSHVGAYGAWLGGRRDGDDALVDPRARDHAARDFKRHLKVDRGWKPSSVNLALAAVDHFNRVTQPPDDCINRPTFQQADNLQRAVPLGAGFAVRLTARQEGVVNVFHWEHFTMCWLGWTPVTER